MSKLLMIFLIFFVSVFPHKKDPEKILERVKKNFERINDYKVNVKIKVDVDFIKVPDMQAKLYFKQPDKMQLDSEGFAMLPKGGMNFSPSSLLSGNYTSFYEKDELRDGVKNSVIKIIPLGDAGDVVLSTIWVDIENYRITKIETNTKTRGSYLIDLKYNPVTDYPLPEAMTFTFNIDKMDLPKGMGGDINTESGKNRKEKTTTGKVFITYSDYTINKGIPDDIFKEPKK